MFYRRWAGTWAMLRRLGNLSSSILESWKLLINTGLWLVETGHVTWVLASHWSRQVTSGLWLVHYHGGPAGHHWRIYRRGQHPREVVLSSDWSILIILTSDWLPGSPASVTRCGTLTTSCTCWWWPPSTTCTPPRRWTSSGCRGTTRVKTLSGKCWPLIGQHRSRDLNTGFWLAVAGRHVSLSSRLFLLIYANHSSLKHWKQTFFGLIL